MKELLRTTVIGINRRTFLRRAAGGAFAVAAGLSVGSREALAVPPCYGGWPACPPANCNGCYCRSTASTTCTFTSCCCHSGTSCWGQGNVVCCDCFCRNSSRSWNCNCVGC